MASISLPIDDAVSFKRALLKKYKIQVPVFKWEDITILRYSIQAYNTSSDLDKLLMAVKELLD